MEANEIKQLQGYVKKRYEEADMDYRTFEGEIDTDLSFNEAKGVIDNLLKVILPPTKEEKQELLLEQQQKEEAEAKAKFELEIERIISNKTTDELEKLYFKPVEYIRMVATGVEKGLLLYGESSLGKSYRVKRTLAELGKREGEDYFIISGHITPLQFYCKLFMAKDKIVVFDDVNILESKINLNMLKASLNENSYNRVEYHTSKAMPNNVPSSFIFSGQVIILLNSKPNNSEHMRAIENRVISYELKFTYEQIIAIITDIAKQEVEGSTQEERFEVVRWIKDNTNKATKNLNIRLYQHALRFYVWDKEIWKELATSYIQNDEYTTMILQGCTGKEWEEKTGLSARTMRRYKQELESK